MAVTAVYLSHSYKHMASVIFDGNFSAEHQRMKNPSDDVRFADGHAFMVTDGPYKEHLNTAVQFRQVSWITPLSDRY